MRNIYVLFFSLFISSSLFAQKRVNILVNGTNYSILEGENLNYTTPKGETVSIQVVSNTQPQFIAGKQTYQDKFVQVQYPNQYKREVKRISNSVNQISIKNNSGGGVFIQEFIQLNTEPIVDDVLVSLLGGLPPIQFTNKNIPLIGNRRLIGKSAKDFDGQEITVLASSKNKKGVLVVMIGSEADNQLINIVKNIQIK